MFFWVGGGGIKMEPLHDHFFCFYDLNVITVAGWCGLLMGFSLI